MNVKSKTLQCYALGQSEGSEPQTALRKVIL